MIIFMGLMPVFIGSSNSFGAPNKTQASSLHLATFDVDATPPVGTQLTYDREINKWDLGLRARGIVITGAGQPIVLCAVDWIGIANDGQDAFKEALAEAAGTIPSRVAVHTVHQHDAPECDFGAEKMLKDLGLDPNCYEGTFQREVIGRLKTAVKQSMEHPQEFTQIGLGEAKVYKVASNRRIIGPDGKFQATRYSAAKDPKLRALPEGVIDPMVSLISFWNGDKPVAVLSFYATHPQSYYRTGVANPDFPGLARFYRQLAVPQALHIHFNGAGGNITAGKYNDGSMENRDILAKQLADGMKRAWEATKKQTVTPEAVNWASEPVDLTLAKSISDMDGKIKTLDPIFLANNLYKLVLLKRSQEGKKINVNCLSIGNARMVFLPGEPFIEYQLGAKAMRPDKFVAVAGYGDYATGYICTAKAYDEGGYEAGPASGVTAETKSRLMGVIRKLLNK
jgi:hypothetical protein